MNKYIVIIIIFLFFSFSLTKNDRIVTIGGSITEIVFALGAGKSVVAVDWSSSIPSKVKELPQVGYVRQLSSEGILSMSPTQILATTDMGPPKVIDQIKDVGIDIRIFESPKSFDDIILLITDISKLLDKEKEAKKIISNLNSLNIEINKKQSSFKEKPKVVFFMSPTSNSYNAAGGETKANYLIEYIGGVNIFSDTFNRYSKITKEDIINSNPDIILVGFIKMINPDESELISLFTDNSIFKYVEAVKNKKVIAIDMGQYLNFGPSFVSDALSLTNQINVEKK